MLLIMHIYGSRPKDLLACRLELVHLLEQVGSQEGVRPHVARLQPEGVIRKHSVPPLLPAYNKFMGAVDRTAHIRKTYGFDRKSKRF